jgi:tRNA nucleotidyltransferase (CCA-adding enzyme)
MAPMPTPATDLSDRVRSLAGMEQLLATVEGLPPLYLVGGAVRDLLRGARSVDLDLVVEADAAATAREIAARLRGRAVEHQRFGTATVRTGELVVDIAMARRERYERPGALPEIEPAGLTEDLDRRDFTVNAMAIGLSGSDLGVLRDPCGGLDDLEAGLIRVLHGRSFVDDPTRLLRAVRYETRLGFELETDTERLAREAATAGAIATVSGARLRDELMDLLTEAEAPAAVGRLRELGIARALHPSLRADPELVAGAALASAETGASPALAELAALCSARPAEVEEFVHTLALPAADRTAVLRAASRGPVLAETLHGGLRPSELHALLTPEPPEALALALALGAAGGPVLRYLSDLRGAALEITGEDLLSAGVPRSPAIGRALEETLRRKLDGELAGRDAELRTATELARGRA